MRGEKRESKKVAFYFARTPTNDFSRCRVQAINYCFGRQKTNSAKGRAVNGVVK